VDFGFFDWIAQHILTMLRWFYSVVGNWGLAIILLTVVVRLLVLPFNLYSYKSMRAMQAIQPQIQALRERYKEDQQTQQQEMMRLMRDNKVNPLGGCLPVFLQFPIFIALYQVLGNSIELYQAPFILWIHDLSLKDPYYILPVLMGLTMFTQNKITPNTMDPAQAKVMLMMPLVFTFFMVSLPSGLTLYMLVGAVFGVLQQLYFMRDRRKAASGSAK
jgi:YidC/Oxa1 family membrane protein insertase